MTTKPRKGRVFVITQIGGQDSIQLKRADAIVRYVIKPSLAAIGLEMYGVSFDPTPGQTPQMVKALIGSPVVIADLTTRNPNVYYELGIAHSFGKKTIIICDSVESLAFDTKDERAITLGDTYPITAEQAEKGIADLTATLRTVLDPAHEASSVVSKAAASRSLEALAPNNPIVSELEVIKDGIEYLKSAAKPRMAIPRSLSADMASMRHIVEALVSEGRVSPSNLWGAENEYTSSSFGSWLEGLREKIKPGADDPWTAKVQDDPWAADVKESDRGFADEPTQRLHDHVRIQRQLGEDAPEL